MGWESGHIFIVPHELSLDPAFVRQLCDPENRSVILKTESAILSGAKHLRLQRRNRPRSILKRASGR
jgi:hypothetical protein